MVPLFGWFGFDTWVCFFGRHDGIHPHMPTMYTALKWEPSASTRVPQGILPLALPGSGRSMSLTLCTNWRFRSRSLLWGPAYFTGHRLCTASQQWPPLGRAFLISRGVHGPGGQRWRAGGKKLFFLGDQHFIRKKKYLITLGRLKNQREGINTLNDPATKRP